MQFPIKKAARLAEVAIGVAALAWLGAHGRPFVTDAQYRRRLVADVHRRVGAARAGLRGQVARLGHRTRQARDAVKDTASEAAAKASGVAAKAGEVIDDVVPGKDKCVEDYFCWWSGGKLGGRCPDPGQHSNGLLHPEPIESPALHSSPTFTLFVSITPLSQEARAAATPGVPEQAVLEVVGRVIR